MTSDLRATRYCDIEPLCHPDNRFNRGAPLRGCPHDGLGCVGVASCTIHNPNLTIAERFHMPLSRFVCWKAKSAR